MKTKILSILALLLTVTQGAWAQTTADIGRVIAADGKMYKTVTLANKVSTASGVVAYVGTEVVDRYTDNKYLAISLADAGQGAYGGEGNAFESTSDDLATVLTWINGQSVTINGHNRIDDADHPALDLAYNYSTALPSGASWFVASVGQWNMVVKGLTGSNTDLSESVNPDLAYDKVNVKIVAAGATGLILSGSNYVLANPYSKDEVWEYMEEGYVAHYYKNANWYTVRPIFSFLSATNGYVVEYNANGGSGAPAAQSKTHGTALTLSSTVPTRDGYTFAGWATSAEGEVAYSAGDSYTTDNDIVLYAQWTPTYTATFADGNDNTGWDIAPTSGVEGTTVTVSYDGENKVKSVTVKGISAVTSAPTANDLTYTGSAQALVTAGTATYGTMVYSLDGETYSAAIPTATNAGNYTVYYKVDGGTDYTGTTAQTVNVTIGYYIPNTSEAVDLGLSVKWAPFNVGAKTATEYGLYYAWADTEGHYAGDGFNLSWNTTPYYNGSTTSWTKYGSSPATLDSSDDAAAVNWGSSWRMPTETEYRELISNTTQTWQSNYQGSGVSGYLLTSTKAGYTDKSIFISDAGCRAGMDLQNWGARYWSSSLSSDGAQYGMGFRFPGDGSQTGHVNRDNRNLGFTVRAVCPK